MLASSAIVKLVLLSAAAGVAFGTLVVEPLSLALYQHYEIHNDYWFNIGLFKAAEISIQRFPSLFLAAMFITSPLIAMSMFTAVLFRRLISRHLAIWCCTAPFAVWIFVCILSAVIIDNLWAHQHSFFDRLLYEMKSIDGAIFFFAPLASTIVFYCAARSKLAPVHGLEPDPRP